MKRFLLAGLVGLALLAGVAGKPAAAQGLNDWADLADQKVLTATAAQTASTNSTGVDLQGYYGKAAVIGDFAACTGTTPTLNVKLQDSADNSTFADISPAIAFSQVTTSASQQLVTFQAGQVRRYVRAASTITGTTPSCTYSVEALVPKPVH